MSRLSEQHCESGSITLEKLPTSDLPGLQSQIDSEWHITENRLGIERQFRFENYYQTIAFVNAVAWIAHMEDHHPDLHVGYNRCIVRYTTHSVGGLSYNDFICAAKVDALIDQGF